MSLLMNIHAINTCLTVACDIESDIFDSSFKGLFRKKNYSGNEQKLSVVLVKLGELSNELNATQVQHSGIARVIDDATEYVDALIQSTTQLRLINLKLAKKASGSSYSMSDYRQDVQSFKSLQDFYCLLGDRLNADYQLYSAQIAMLDY